jgi:hypothetical protein
MAYGRWLMAQTGNGEENQGRTATRRVMGPDTCSFTNVVASHVHHTPDERPLSKSKVGHSSITEMWLGLLQVGSYRIDLIEHKGERSAD